MRGNPQALFGKRPTEKDPAKGTSPAVDFTREGACGKRTAATPKPRPQAYLTLHPGAAPPCLARTQQTRSKNSSQTPGMTRYANHKEALT